MDPLPETLPQAEPARDLIRNTAGAISQESEQISPPPM
jgi:hypothetical protein